MAYFSNSTEGSVFDCSEKGCKYADQPCPIFYVQLTYNYEAVNNKIATEILNELVKDDGTCTFFEMAKADLFQDPNQLNLFGGK